MTIENFKMPVGRIVGGNPAIAQNKTNFHTKQDELDKNGQPILEWRCEIAYTKQEFLEKIWPYMNQEVSKLYPAYNNMHPDNYEHSKFSFKIINGDSPSCPQGSKIAYNTREGYPGCYVIKIRTSAFAPGVFKFENGSYRKLEPSEIKCGDYVVLNCNITAHNDKDGGLYWNPNGFELVGYGTEIQTGSGGNPEEMFERQTYQLPIGASAMPVSSAPAQAMGMPAPAQAMGMPAPAHDFVNNVMGFTQPAASVAGLQQPSLPTGVPTAPFATSLPTR